MQGASSDGVCATPNLLQRSRLPVFANPEGFEIWSFTLFDANFIFYANDIQVECISTSSCAALDEYLSFFVRKIRNDNTVLPTYRQLSFLQTPGFGVLNPAGFSVGGEVLAVKSATSQSLTPLRARHLVRPAPPNMLLVGEMVTTL